MYSSQWRKDFFMDDKKNIQDIMILVKKKFNNIEQILNHTNEIQESMAQDDFDTVNMLLDMRAVLMDESDKIEEAIATKKTQLSEEYQIRISCLLSDTMITSDISFEETKIKEMYIMTKTMVSKIIELDKILEYQISAKNKLLALENS